jgi:hypothetical protein
MKKLFANLNKALPSWVGFLILLVGIVSLVFWGKGGLAIIFILSVAVYFVPSFVAEARKKKNKKAIIALNVFLGWTLVGWVVALVWALTVDEPIKL